MHLQLSFSIYILISVMSPDILEHYKSNLNYSFATNEFSLSGYLLLCWKDSQLLMHGIFIEIRENLPMTKKLVLESLDEYFISFRLFLLLSLSYHFSLYRCTFSQNLTILDKYLTRGLIILILLMFHIYKLTLFSVAHSLRQIVLDI